MRQTIHPEPSGLAQYELLDRAVVSVRLKCSTSNSHLSVPEFFGIQSASSHLPVLSPRIMATDIGHPGDVSRIQRYHPQHPH